MVKKNQQRAVMILDSKNVPYTVIDITDPASEDSKDYMVETAKPKEGFKIPVTPQIYNEADYCGDYDGLDMANECDTLGDFLKLSEDEKASIKIGITGIIPTGKKESKESHITNGMSTSREGSQEKKGSSVPVVNEQVDNLEKATNNDEAAPVTPEVDSKEAIEEKPVETPVTKEENKAVEEPVEAKSDPEVAKTEPVVAKTEPVVAKTEPVVAKTEPVVAKIEPTPLDDDDDLSSDSEDEDSDEE